MASQITDSQRAPGTGHEKHTQRRRPPVAGTIRKGTVAVQPQTERSPGHYEIIPIGCADHG